MKIYYLLVLVALSVFLSGCLKSNQAKPESNLIIADEKFCITKTTSNASSDEAYELAMASECAKIGTIKEDCDCDSSTYICTFTIETDNVNCNQTCLVDLKTKAVTIDESCKIDAPAGE